MLKRAHKGTFHKISPKHLDRYVQEFAGKHNIRQLGTLAQMRDTVARLVGRRLLLRDLIVDKRPFVGFQVVRFRCAEIGLSPASPGWHPLDRGFGSSIGFMAFSPFVVYSCLWKPIPETPSTLTFKEPRVILTLESDAFDHNLTSLGELGELGELLGEVVDGLVHLGDFPGELGRVNLDGDTTSGTHEVRTRLQSSDRLSQLVSALGAAKPQLLCAKKILQAPL